MARSIWAVSCDLFFLLQKAQVVARIERVAELMSQIHFVRFPFHIPLSFHLKQREVADDTPRAATCAF
jgi:hypothetical protein